MIEGRNISEEHRKLDVSLERYLFLYYLADTDGAMKATVIQLLNCGRINKKMFRSLSRSLSIVNDGANSS